MKKGIYHSPRPEHLLFQMLGGCWYGDYKEEESMSSSVNDAKIQHSIMYCLSHHFYMKLELLLMVNSNSLPFSFIKINNAQLLLKNY